MDTSKKYIEMCWRTKEIQEKWEKHAGDWLFSPMGIRVLSSKVIRVESEQRTVRFAIPKRMTLTSPILDSSPDNALTTGIDYIDFDVFSQKECIWLPRQDQLQKMITESEPYRLFNKLYAFGECAYPFETPEQLTLAYVMHEKFNKKWNDSEWV